MKILDITLFFPPQVGGAVTTTTEFIKSLIKHNYTVEVLAPLEEYNLSGLKVEKDHFKNKNVIVNRVPLWKKISKWSMIFTYTIFVYKNLRTNKYRLILSHFHFNTGAGWTAFLVSKILNVPYFLRIHDLYKPITFKEKLFYFINKIPLKSASRILVINDVSKEFLVNNNFALDDKIEVIPNGVSNISCEKSVKSVRKHIGFLGTISANRGLKLIIPLAEKLSMNGIEVIFHIVGSGPDLGSLKKQVECNSTLKDKVIFYGTLSRDKAINKIKDMDICIGLLENDNSNEYQLLIKLIESIHLGIPWVSVKTKGVLEFNDKTESGIVVDADIEEIYKGIKELLINNKLYEEKVKGCYENRKKFDWEYISQLLNETIRVESSS